MTVKEAFLVGEGVVDALRQTSLSAIGWQDFRSRVNKALPDHIAYCVACNDPVHVKAAMSKSVAPHFAHYAGGGRTCPWGPDYNKNPDSVRADIFGGNQESDFHRHMCNLALELVMLDSRYLPGSGMVNSYIRPTSDRHGRWPDVQFEFSGLGKFALEVQFAPSLAIEVVERSKFYVVEGRNLLWLLPWYSFEKVERAFAADIAYEARGNFFVLDEVAIDESRSRKTLFVWVAWRSDGELHKKLISLDELNYQKGRHPYLVDAFTPKLFLEAEERRVKISSKMILNKAWSFTPAKLLDDQDEQPEYEGGRLLRVLISLWT